MRNQSGWWRVLVLLLGASLVSACTTPPPKPRQPSAGHIGTTHAAPAAVIPQPVVRAPILPAPKATPKAETYTVVVDNVPVRELLFALARDAKRDVDIHPDITGNVTLNAIDQTLPQILDRLSRLIDLRYRIQNKALLITPDRPYLKTYTVDYVNMSRDTEGTVSVATQIATTGSDSESGGGGGGGNNNSATEVSSSSKNHFWETLTNSLREILAATVNPLTSEDSGGVNEGLIIPNPEVGIIAISATERQHAKVRDYLDKVLGSARRQVMMEATIVEVELNDTYQSGINFDILAGAASSIVLGPTTIPGTAFATAIFDNAKPGGNQDFSLTVNLLKEFGDVRVLSSPKIMVLNNQTAIFKVVENLVFFTVETETVITDGVADKNTTTTPHTVPVGLVMAVTPQISASDEVVINVRPTITRSDRSVDDPNPDLRTGVGDIPNSIPVIQVREMESMLRLQSNQIAVLGGLMQDSVRKDTAGLPVLSEQEGPTGELFKSRDNDFTKTELVIFLRPTVIRSPSVSGDLANFQRFLPENLKSAKPQTGLPQGQSK